MKSFFKCIILPATILCLAVVAYRYYMDEYNNTTDKNIEYIREHINSRGVLVDPFGEIGVKSIDDIRLYVTEKEVRIEYGEIQLKWKMSEFMDSKYDTPLGAIGITRTLHPRTGELEVYYNGELLERWAS